MWRSQLYVHPEPSYELLKAWQKKGTNTLPLVWKHCWAASRWCWARPRCNCRHGHDRKRGIADSPARLGDAAQFVYRHEWKLGDLVIWDNTGTMHRTLTYDHKSGRLMHRTKLEGEEAFA